MTGRILAGVTAALAAIAVAGAGAAAADPAPAPPVPAPAVPGPAAPAQPGAPLPDTGEVAGMLTRLSDAGVGYKEKSNLVENGIDAEDGHVLDHELRKAYRDGELPYNFDVLNVVPTGADKALANVTVSGPKLAPRTVPLQLVDQGSWVLTQDSAKALIQLLAAR